MRYGPAVALPIIPPHQSQELPDSVLRSTKDGGRTRIAEIESLVSYPLDDLGLVAPPPTTTGGAQAVKLSAVSPR